MKARYREGLSVASLLMALNIPSAFAEVPSLNGGIGDDEFAAMQADATNYNLQLTFAEKGSGAYVSGVKVVVRDAANAVVTEIGDAGPLVFVRLPAGSYRIEAAAGGFTQTRVLAVSAGRSARAWLYWPAANGGAAR